MSHKVRPKAWSVLCELIKKYKFLIRLGLTDETTTRWSSWLIEPVSNCVESDCGPIEKTKIKWIEIDPRPTKDSKIQNPGKFLEAIKQELTDFEISFVQDQEILHVNTRKFKL